MLAFSIETWKDLCIQFKTTTTTLLWNSERPSVLPGAVYHLLTQLLQIILTPTGHGDRNLGGGNGLLRRGARMFAGTQTTSSPVSLETLLPLLPQTLNTPAMSERKRPQKQNTIKPIRSKKRLLAHFTKHLSQYSKMGAVATNKQSSSHTEPDFTKIS